MWTHNANLEEWETAKNVNKILMNIHVKEDI